MTKFAIFNKKKTRRQLTKLKLKRIDYFAIWKENLKKNLKNHRRSFLFNRNHNIASFLTFHLDNHPHIRTINIFKNNFWCSVERLSSITSDVPDVIFKESGRSDRSEAARRAFCLDFRSRRLSYSLVYSIVTKRLHKKGARWRRERVHRRRMAERAVTCRAYCHALGLVANKCGAERVGDEGWKRQSRGDTVSPFWRPCCLEKEEIENQRRRKIEPPYCDEDSYSGLR